MSCEGCGEFSFLFGKFLSKGGKGEGLDDNVGAVDFLRSVSGDRLDFNLFLFRQRRPDPDSFLPHRATSQ